MSIPKEEKLEEVNVGEGKVGEEKKRTKVKAGDILIFRLTGQKAMVMGRMMDQLDSVFMRWQLADGNFTAFPMKLWEFEGFPMPEKTDMITIQQRQPNQPQQTSPFVGK